MQINIPISLFSTFDMYILDAYVTWRGNTGGNEYNGITGKRDLKPCGGILVLDAL